MKENYGDDVNLVYMDTVSFLLDFNPEDAPREGVAELIAFSTHLIYVAAIGVVEKVDGENNLKRRLTKFYCIT